VKCRKLTDTIDKTTIINKKNTSTLTGKCIVCGTKKFRFIKITDALRKKRHGGDIAASLESLPGTPWAKYPGEKHLPGYSYCGPGTRLDIRLDDNDQPNPGEFPVNAIDKACYIHDLAYRSSDLQQRHLADINLIHALNNIPGKSFKEKIASFVIKSAMKGKLLVGASV
jgi:hypothetical protein